jgi:shikimate kinase/3-dehydroquinate synthase
MSPGDSRAPRLETPDLILTGFMGSGKSRVGREVARRLGRPFLDMDAEIEARAGKSIPRIFAEDGEDAFRRLEASLCEELSREGGPGAEARARVIATGGGTLVDPGNRSAMARRGTLVCLRCDADEVLRRIGGAEDSERPLLAVADPRAEVERLLAARQQAYTAIPWQVDTTRLSIEETAEQVMAFASVVSLPVHHPSGSLDAPGGGAYPIHIGTGLLDHVGDALRATGLSRGTRVAVVSNPVVAPLYGAQVEASLSSAGFQPIVCAIPDGEQHKTLATVAALYDQFLAAGLDRSSAVLSLGGGVTGDVAGFAAASFMRGVRFVQVPTTILAMADASVGGKTGVDLPQGKNLVGAFKQPILVLMDPAVLVTLPQDEIRSGMAEVIKHGILGDPDLFLQLESGPAPSQRLALSAAQLAHTIQVKIDIVEEDPFEQGRRAILNLGHTVGHGLERLSGFSLRHGEAISIGTVAAARIAAELGRAAPSLPGRIASALAAWGLPVRCPPFETDAIWAAMAHDKKRKGRALRWVLPHDIGQVEIADDVAPEVVKRVLGDLCR